MSVINKMSNKKVTMMKLRRIIQMLSEGYSEFENNQSLSIMI